MLNHSIGHIQCPHPGKPGPKPQIDIFDVTEKILVKASGGIKNLSSIESGRSARREDLVVFKVSPLRLLAVTTAQRASALPDTPTVAETVLPGFSASVWYGLLAPRGTPQPVVDQLYRSFRTALANPQVQERLKALAADPMQSDPAAFGKFMAGETTRWSRVIQQLGLKPE
jgi:hypothetical protein